jgi:hypothetical protein
MDKIANLDDRERKDLFQATASKMGIHAAIVEKDFWVCWALNRIFTDDKLGSNVVFKGGTSLSKAYNLIERFSEDIDLVLDWDLIGYGEGGTDPLESQPSKSQLNKFLKEFNERADEFIRGDLCEQLKNVFSVCPRISVSASRTEEQVIEVDYPAAFELSALRPGVKLEIGPLAAWIPSSTRSVSSYAAEEFPELFAVGSCDVLVTDAERTFWEKATILHQIAHREANVPAAYSRHYYDVYKLASSDVRDLALSDLNLLREVVAFKQRFYPSNTAGYEQATPGSFRLIPNDQVKIELKADYRAMQEMIYGDVPTWDEILDLLSELEDEINEK